LAGPIVPQKIFQILMPFFSVIIPAKNEAAHLQRCFQSLVAQSNKDFEAIFVNDGSSDATPGMLEAFAVKFDWCKVLHTNGIGLGAARNLAAQQASGTFLVFLDADDFWKPHKLEKLHEAITQNPKKFWFYHPVLELFPDDTTRLRHCYHLRFHKEFFLRGNPFTPSAVAIKKTAFEMCGGFETDPNQVEDLRLWLHLLKLGYIPGFIPEPLTLYNIGSGVTTQIASHHKKVQAAVASAVEKGLLGKRNAKRLLRRKMYEVARFHHKNGHHKAAFKYYRKAPFTLRKFFWMTLAFFKMGDRL